MGVSLFYCSCSERSRGNDLKLRQGRFKLDIKGLGFFPVVRVKWIAQGGSGVIIPVSV